MRTVAPTSRTTHKRLLDLKYHPDVSRTVLERLEAAARLYGLSLERLELLGQDAELATGFAQAVVEEDAEDYLRVVPWDHLERRLVAQDRSP